MGKNALIVTHATNIQAIDYYFIGKPKDYDLYKPTIIKIGELLTYHN